MIDIFGKGGKHSYDQEILIDIFFQILEYLLTGMATQIQLEITQASAK